MADRNLPSWFPALLIFVLLAWSALALMTRFETTAPIQHGPQGLYMGDQ